ncbi:hypothetical protein EJB05_42606 [Eragrostis curvula]|uniref:Uncharacterized protein n=1 Tax=Eragrostis curvula TaxID=38414 RepID=A0A5J9SJM1_9POAL|nr:hypothetical protein EJB05_55471 [Eragrostis curvula]TVU09161.1 hypothetical protein EJB05_42606 [Eragrostis curvula]
MDAISVVIHRVSILGLRGTRSPGVDQYDSCGLRVFVMTTDGKGRKRKCKMARRCKPGKVAEKQMASSAADGDAADTHRQRHASSRVSSSSDDAPA